MAPFFSLILNFKKITCNIFFHIFIRQIKKKCWWYSFLLWRIVPNGIQCCYTIECLIEMPFSFICLLIAVCWFQINHRYELINRRMRVNQFWTRTSTEYMSMATKWLLLSSFIRIGYLNTFIWIQRSWQQCR